MKKLFATLLLVPMLVLGSDMPAEKTVSYTGTAGVSSAMFVGRKIIRCTSDCYYVMGNANTIVATSASILLQANQLWEVYVDPGNRYISFVQRASAGTAYVYPVVE